MSLLSYILSSRCFQNTFTATPKSRDTTLWNHRAETYEHVYWIYHPHNVRGLESTRGRRLSGVDSGLLALWGWYCSCIKCNFHKFIAIIRHWIIKSRFINYFLEKFYHVLLVYKERERMFFSEFSRTEWLFVTRGTLPLSFFSLHCKKIPWVYYYIINCRSHFVGWKALNTQMRFQYLLSGAQRTELSNLVIVYS